MLAVLPFENLTGDPNKEYLAGGSLLSTPVCDRLATLFALRSASGNRRLEITSLPVRLYLLDLTEAKYRNFIVQRLVQPLPVGKPTT